MQNQKELDELINAIMEKSQKPEQTSQVADTAKAPVTAPVPKQNADTHKQKMAKIKEALAKANAETSAEPIPEAPKSVKEEREKQAAAETREIPPPEIVSTAKIAENEKKKEQTEKMPEPVKSEKTAKMVLPVVPQVEDDETLEDDEFLEDEEEIASEDEEVEEVQSAPIKSKGSSGKNGNGDSVAVKGVSMQLMAAFLGVGLAASFVASYFLVANTYQEKFLPNTYVNAVKIDGMGMAEAEEE